LFDLELSSDLLVSCHGDLERLLHRAHNQVNLVQVLHSKNPTSQVGSDKIDTFQGILVKSLIFCELLKFLDVSFFHVLRWIINQLRQEIVLSHSLLGWFPVVSFSFLSLWVHLLLRFLIKQDHHSRNNHFDSVDRHLDCLHFSDILL